MHKFFLKFSLSGGKYFELSLEFTAGPCTGENRPHELGLEVVC